MKLVKVIALSWIIAVVFYVWGLWTVQHKVFPWKWIGPLSSELSQYFKGHDEETTSASDKILNDLNLSPKRQLTDEYPESTYLDSASNKEYREIQLHNVNSRRMSPLFFDQREEIQSGYYFVFGAFDFIDHMHGGVLFDTNFQVLHTWVFTENEIISELNAVAEKFKSKGRKTPKSKVYQEPNSRFPHGFVLLPDGALIYNDGDPGNGLFKIDRCSRYQWHKTGKYHHSMELDHEGKIWTYEDDFLISLNPATGEKIHSISWHQIREANDDIGLDLRYFTPTGHWLKDPFHFNDLDPLPPELSKVFPQFEAGDLLISLRSINLVAVIDPESLKIKWWRVGAARRQHDPDWHESGTILIYNNNRRAERNSGQWEKNRYSNIVALDPRTYESKIVYDGKLNNFYSGKRGRFQSMPNGNFLITSSQQGRVFETTEQGTIMMEIINRYNEDNNFVVSEAQWIPKNYFSFDPGNNKDCK